MTELTTRADIEIARNIVAGIRVEIDNMERFWPKSKRGSNAQRIWTGISDKADAALVCLEDALEGMRP